MKEKGFFRFKIGLTVGSSIGAVITKIAISYINFQNIHTGWLTVIEILYDVFICIVSAMILVWFIDETNERLRKKIPKKKKKRKLENLIKCYNAI